jgi:hypothetical protein
MHVRFERSDGTLERIDEGDLPNVSEQVIVGPFEWVQLTYEELRVAPDGDVIAYLDEGDWTIVGPDQPRGGRAAKSSALHFSKADLIYPFSDVVIYGAG